MQPTRDIVRSQRLREIASTLRKAYSAEPANMPEHLKQQMHRIKEAGAHESQR